MSFYVYDYMIYNSISSRAFSALQYAVAYVFKSFSNIVQCPDFQHDCGDGKCIEEWRRSAHCT